MPSFIILVLLAVIFIAIGFIGGVVTTLIWFQSEHSANAADDDEFTLEEQPVDVELVQQDQLSGEQKGSFTVQTGVDNSEAISFENEERITKEITELEQIAQDLTGWAEGQKEEQNLSVSSGVPGQVDRIVQDLIAGSPLENQIIRIIGGEDGGLNFSVDGECYDEIEMIPDAEIQHVIRTAAEQWSKMEK